jgi:hypothetical protein
MTRAEKRGEASRMSPEAPGEIVYHTMDSLPLVLQMLDFPASQETIRHRFGRLEIQWSLTETITLQDALSEISEPCFANLDDLMNALFSSIRLAYGDHLEPDEQIIDH